MKITLLENDSSNSYFTFLIEGISNTLIKELNEFIKSDIFLYPLENLKKEYSLSSQDSLRASKYIVTNNNPQKHEKNIRILENLRISLQSKLEKDIQDYIPEFYKRNATFKFDTEKLKELIEARSNNINLQEQKDLGKFLYKALPKEIKNLFESEEY